MAVCPAAGAAFNTPEELTKPLLMKCHQQILWAFIGIVLVDPLDDLAENIQRVIPSMELVLVGGILAMRINLVEILV